MRDHNPIEGDYTGDYNGSPYEFAIVVSRFNEPISEALLRGGLDAFKRHHAKRVDVVWVPGSFEIPPVTKRLAESKKYQAILCLGAIIRGETAHFDYIAGEVSRGIAQTSLMTGIPVVFGVLTTETVEQAWARAGVKMGNKGFEGAMTAIELANLYDKLPKRG